MTTALGSQSSRAINKEVIASHTAAGSRNAARLQDARDHLVT